MELAIHIQIEELPEGPFLATSEELPGLVAQGRTVAEALDIARDVARRLIEAQRERDGVPSLPAAAEWRDYTIVIAAWMGNFLKTWIAADQAGNWGVALMPAYKAGGVRAAVRGRR